MTFDINNQQIMHLSQASHDGDVTAKVCYQDQVESEFTVSAGDMITLLNWYRYQKNHGNERLEF